MTGRKIIVNMTSERWRRLEQLFYEARDLRPVDVDAFLLEKCGDDPELRKEIALLLESEGSDTDLPSLGNPAWEAVLRGAPVSRRFKPGDSFGFYCIRDFIGSGGMGDVYLAEDTRLRRKVALKVLAGWLDGQPTLVTRFTQEALAASALNHPNVPVVYEAGEIDQRHFIASEYVDGSPLSDRIARSPMRWREAIAVTLQVADALCVAHAAGIVHRDVKPGNILIAKDCQVKLVDFGIAKLARRSDSESDPSLTPFGMVIGTPGYMAPELTTGLPADARSDIWSLAAVLYQMIEGRLPTPGISKLTASSDLPSPLTPVLERALQPDPAKRFSAMTEFAAALKDAERDSGSTLRSPLVRRIVFGSAAAAVVVLGILAVAPRFRARKAVLTPQDTVVLADFTNTTGDAVFDDALKQGLLVGLEQSPIVQILSDKKADTVLRQMGRSPDERMAGPVALELCKRVGGAMTVEGSVSSIGSSYLVGLTARRCDTGDPVAHEQAEAKGKENVVGVLGKAAVRLRERLGESLPSIQRNNAPLEQATTPSLDALNAFEKGLEAANKGSKEEAAGHFRMALELDPNFAMAYVELAEFDWNNGEFELARKNGLKAYELKDRVTELERTYIEFFHSLFVNGDLERAKQTYELALRKYPPTLRILNDLGLVYFSLGEYTKSEPMFRGSLRLAQTDDTILNLVVTLTGLNRVGEADAVVASALPPNVQTDRLLTPRYWLAFLHGDTAKMQRLVSQSSVARDTLLAYQADTDAWFGHFRKSREDRSEAAKIAERDGDRESAANTLLTGAVWESEVGNSAQAKSYASKALGLSRSLDSVTPLVALVMAKTGDSRQALLLEDQLAKERPLDTLVQKYWIPLIRAQVELRQGRWMGAIQALQVAESLDYAVPGGFENSLYPPYVRGEAWLAGRDGVKAAIEFRKLIDHPGMLLNSPLGVLAYLGQARAYVLASQPDKAQTAYREFFNLWKDADPDIPILRTARDELARLQAGSPVR